MPFNPPRAACVPRVFLRGGKKKKKKKKMEKKKIHARAHRDTHVAYVARFDSAGLNLSPKQRPFKFRAWVINLINGGSSIRVVSNRPLPPRARGAF